MFENIPHSKPWITQEDKIAVDEVLDSGMIAQGKMTEKFELKISSYLNLESSIACSSGTSALILALRSLGICNKSEVILPSYVCKSVYESVITVGAKPIICDIGENWVMDFENIEPLISKKTSAIILVHTFGLPADIDSFQVVDVPIIEDACQAFGLTSKSRKAGTLGDVSIFSFHATKCLSTGEGGMLNSNNPNIISRATSLKNGAKKLDSIISSPMSDLQAALGISQFNRYNKFLKRRRLIKNIFINELQNHIPLKTIIVDADYLFRFPLFLKGYDRNKIMDTLANKNIIARLGVDQTIHSKLGLDNSGFPNTVSAINNTLSIPFYPALSDIDISRIIEELKKIFN
ncbi:MAG: DegT/DnrJ/EryC1/StrS family aminotransferase [Candidatus Neomarinimicrobiota bacterium]